MPTPPRTKRILILDDEPGILEVLGHYLRSLGFDPVTTTRWTEALDVIAHTTPDLILLDLNMPTIQGDAILAYIQQLEHPIPSIILSAHLDPSRMEKVRDLGARRCLSKPFQLSEVAMAIREELGLPVESPGPAPDGPHPAGDAEEAGDGDAIFTALDQEVAELAAGRTAPDDSAAHHGHHAHHARHRKPANVKLYVLICLVCVVATLVVLVLQRLPDWMSGTLEQAMEKSMQSEMKRQAKEKGLDELSDKEKEALRKALK
jgi:CheY-like chemotaxis protein